MEGSVTWSLAVVLVGFGIWIGVPVGMWIVSRR